MRTSSEVWLVSLARTMEKETGSQASSSAARTILNLGCGTKPSADPEVVNVDWSMYQRHASHVGCAVADLGAVGEAFVTSPGVFEVRNHVVDPVMELIPVAARFTRTSDQLTD